MKPTAQAKSIVILSTQRSGSTMVCDDLISTGVLGRPSEYYLEYFSNYQKVAPELRGQLFHRLLARGLSENGVCGVKVMASYVGMCGDMIRQLGLCSSKDAVKGFFEFYANSIFARVVRKNRIEQAVSRVLAEATGRYHAASAPDASLVRDFGKVDNGETPLISPEYSRELIKREMIKIDQEEKFWDDNLKSNQIDPIVINYEVATLDRSFVATLGARLGFDHIQAGPRRLKKVGGAVANEWVARFQTEA